MDETLKVIITAEINKLKSGIAEAKKQVASFKDEVKNAKADVGKHFKAMGESIKTGLGNAVKVGAGALTGVTAALMATTAATEEYRQGQAQLNAAFEQAGMTTNNATQAYRKLYSVIGDDAQAVESAANIAMLASNEKEMVKWTELASGVLGTFHDTLQPEAFYEAANETLKLGEATGAFTQMLEQTGIVSVEEFNAKLAACNTEAEKQAYMLSVSEQAMGKAGEVYDKQTEKLQKQREAQAKLTENMARLGEAMTPVVTAFTNFANEALAKVTPHIEAISEKYAPKLEPALSKMAETVGKIVGFISEHWQIIAGIGAVIGGIAAAIGLYNTVAAVKAAMDLAQVTTLGALAKSYLAQAAAMAVAIAPYALIVAAIAGVIAIIVVCVKHWDTIKTKVTEVWKHIQKETGVAVKAVTDGFNDLKKNMSDKVAEAKKSVLNIFDDISGGIEKRINKARDAVKKAIDKIKGFFNFKWKLPELKLPTISVKGKFSLNPPSTPKFSINWNKLGGVFDKPTVFGYGDSLQGIGEQGAEAVVPLENNTQWLNRIADMLVDKLGTNQTIILQVDGKTLGRVAASSINGITAQTGKCPIKVM